MYLNELSTKRKIKGHIMIGILYALFYISVVMLGSSCAKEVIKGLDS